MTAVPPFPSTPWPIGSLVARGPPAGACSTSSIRRAPPGSIRTAASTSIPATRSYVSIWSGGRAFRMRPGSKHLGTNRRQRPIGAGSSNRSKLRPASYSHRVSARHRLQGGHVLNSGASCSAGWSRPRPTTRGAGSTLLRVACVRRCWITGAVRVVTRRPALRRGNTSRGST